MIKLIGATLVSSSLLLANPALAREVTVEITNLTNGIYFTPLLVAAHHRNQHLFELGESASPELQAMAEGGNIAGLIAEVSSAGGDYVADPAEGLLAPGMSTTAELDVSGKRGLSVAAMLLPTNDGFVGLDNIKIPIKSGTYTFFLRGYDAGTEANDEIVNGGGAPGIPGIPADPGGHAGTGGTGVAGDDDNANVHIHRGNVGDQDPTGGASDLDSGAHRWANPVARVVITVTHDGRYGRYGRHH
ncbi:MAG: hypothetical protein GY779_14730 [Gammaproteobacteria bacterium]|nr:hypothetical protein [Gammaproteobacteria bacterium]